MRRNNWLGLLILIGRLAVAGVFLTAALPKIQDPASFTESVQAYQLISPISAAWVALVLPWMELVIGLGLLTRPLRRSSGCVILLLLGLFIALHLSAWTRGLDLECGCFGRADSTQPTSYLALILRNSALLLTICCIVIHDFKQAKRAKFSK